jgi:hypothetical protein
MSTSICCLLSRGITFDDSSLYGKACRDATQVQKQGVLSYNCILGSLSKLLTSSTKNQHALVQTKDRGMVVANVILNICVPFINFRADRFQSQV